MFEKILASYGLSAHEYNIQPLTNGLINHTWKVAGRDNAYILQQINTAVFKNPEAIAYNIRAVSDYLKIHQPDYLFIAPVQTMSGNEMVIDGEHHYFRLFPYVHPSHSINTVQTPQQAFEAARQFGLFTKLLSGFKVQTLKITIPHFHDLSLRYLHFEKAINNGLPERIEVATDEIAYLKSQQSIVQTFEGLKKDSGFTYRVMHHDTKISNVLFNEKDKGLCVIDLDTVMPGYFISDAGDMMRTYISAANEEESDLSKIDVREDYVEAIVRGYLSQMKTELSSNEKRHFIYAGKFMIYMQALRFLTDYLNNDVYYGSRYPNHNLIRTRNQTVLLQKLIEKEKTLEAMVKDYL